MTGTTQRSAEVVKVRNMPEIQELPLAARVAIELALVAEYARGMEGAYVMGQVRGLKRARNLPRFTFRAVGKHITGYVSVNAIDAEIWKLEGEPHE